MTMKSRTGKAAAILSFAVFAANAGADAPSEGASVSTNLCARPIPAFIFGQNLEHTRAAVQGGLSAEIVRNRKFAGKPSVKGVALMWDAYGDQAEYYHAFSHLVRHAAKSRMFRQNERRCQVMGCLVDGGEAGIMQRGGGFTSEVQIDEVVTELVEDRSLVFRDLYFSQNESSQRLLSAIAAEGEARGLMSGEFIERHHLVATSSVRSALEVLLAKDLVYRTETGYVVYDRIFGEWLRARENPV